MGNRDHDILDHLGLYRLSLRAIIARLFFAGGNPGNVIHRLRDRGEIVERRLAGRLNYYQISAKAARARGLPLKRARPFSNRNQAFHTHLAALWFCCIGTTRRIRLERKDLVQLFPGEIAEGPLPPHCLERGTSYRLYRLFVVAPDSDTTHLAGRLHRYLEGMLKRPQMGEWIRGRQYGFAILATNEEKLRSIDASLANEGLKPLVHAHLAVTPDQNTIVRAIHELE
jgi:hypothetical protein